MLNASNTVKCSKVLDKHCKQNQLLKLIEELGELSRAASIVLQNWQHGVTDNFKEELADVYVMCQQAQLMFDIDDYSINEMAEKKLDRTLDNRERMWEVMVAFLRCDSDRIEYSRTFRIKADDGESAKQIVFNGLSIMEFSNFKILKVRRVQ